jgi:hypothetical protein
MIHSKLKKIVRFLLNADLYVSFFHNVGMMRKLNNAPVIVCGSPRSGTSLLISILDSHNEIHAIPFETTVLQYRPEEKRIFRNKALHFWFTKLQLKAYLFSNKIKSTAKVWCEKNPLNILNIEEIAQIFNGNVKFINIVRDGRDVVSSFHPRFGYMVKAKLWSRCIQQTLTFSGRENFLVLRYEDLIQQPQVELNRIRDFLGLQEEFDVKNWLSKTNIKGFILSPVNNNMGVSIISSDLNQNSIGNWKKSPSPNITEFLNDENCLKLNKDLGYS